MPQTVEAINHIKAANVPFIIAINKMDKYDANPDRIKQELMEYGVVAEEWGGDAITIPVSAKTGQGIDELLEMVLMVAELSELKANPNRNAIGTIIEAYLDKGLGSVATILVNKGTLRVGDYVVSGQISGKIRAMYNFRGENIEKVTPSYPALITGLSDVPEAGDLIYALEDEKEARNLAEEVRLKEREEELKAKYLQEVTKKSLNLMKNKDLDKQIEICNQIINYLSEQVEDEEIKENNIHKNGEILLSIEEKLNKSKIKNNNIRPITPISQSYLFTNSNNEPDLINELKREIASSDSIDILVSFIRWSGLRLIKDELIEHTKTKKLRIITTSYMGASEFRAIKFLSQLPDRKSVV